ncbi:hypothetical protein J3R83DRAFT_11063 [Lanmaoa asiatica]|nr:hypothetical protein J3R83DRAFT_11063 [Lanmaoa asiatica]
MFPRLDYILWIQDIVKTFVFGDEVVRGIDMCALTSSVKFDLLIHEAAGLEPPPYIHCWHVAWNQGGPLSLLLRFTLLRDIDKESLVSARQNVERNGFSNRITIVDTSSNGSILQTLEGALAVPFHFTMCNPPFYASMEEVVQSTEAKEYGPGAACGGSENEMVTPGGEVSFVSRMFTESLHYRMRCRWYTSKVASISSLSLMVDLFREYQVDNYAIIDFTQGEVRRWAVAWSFGTLRLPDVRKYISFPELSLTHHTSQSLARVVDPTLQSIMPFRTTLYQEATSARSLELLYNELLQVLGTIEGVRVNSEHTDSTEVASVLVMATEITWSPSEQRKDMTHPISQKTCEGSTILQCRITCADGSYPVGEKQHVTGLHLVYQWVDGNDRAILESFVSHVSHEVTVVESGL